MSKTSKSPKPRIAVVTGASAGIGRSLALELAAKGFEPLLLARRKDRLEQVVGDVEAAGHTAHAMVLDVTSPGAIEKAFARAESLGELEVLVNNAGIGTYGLFAETDHEATKRVMRLNLDALVEATSMVLPKLIAKKKGYVMNVASTAAFQPIPYQSIYGATKAFVLSFTEALSVELKGTGVKVSALCPGPTATEFLELAEYEKKGLIVPHAFLMTADDVAAIGVRGMLKGKTIVIAGMTNKMGAMATRIAPRSMVAMVAGQMFKPRRDPKE